MSATWFVAERLVLDVRQAVRRLGARPFFTLAALAILSVGVGLNTAAFSLARGLLLRPLPYPEPDAIVAVGQVSADFPGASPQLSSTGLLRLWDEARSFEHLSAHAAAAVVLDGPNGPTNLVVARVSPSFFPLLRVEPQLGRLFAAADAVDGARRVVVLSHGTWTNLFASDTDVVGEVVDLDGEPHAVAGVLSAEFDFGAADLWAPYVVRPDEVPAAGGFVVASGFQALGRLRRGVSPAHAEAEVRTVLDRARPALPTPWSAGLRSRVRPLQEVLGAPFRPALRTFTAAAGLVLLLACANVAGLLLVRANARRRELAVRRALGAGRGRIVGQLLTESVVLSVAGGSVGLAMAAAIVRAALALAPRDVPGLADAGVDGAAAAFAAGLSVVAGLVLGAAPALGWSRGGVVRILNEAGAPSGSSVGRLRASSGQTGLAVAQVALAFTLLTAAGLFLRSFAAFVTFDLGFDPTNVMVARADTRDSRRTGEGRRFGPEEIEARSLAARRSTEALLTRLERIAGLPDVRAAALATRPPLTGSGSGPIGVAGRPAPSDPRDWPRAEVQSVSPGYADAIGLRLLAGRFVTERDAAGSPGVAVVSESFARAAFGGEPAVGQRLTRPVLPVPGAERGETWEIVGVVSDVDSPPPFRSSAAGEVYLSVLQPRMEMAPFRAPPFVAVRTVGDPLAVVPFLREVLADVYPDALVSTTVLDAVLSEQSAWFRFYVVCGGVFGTVALLLAAFGLYSVLGYMVSQRRRELGIRVALGAGNRDVLTLVLRQGGLLVGAGAIIGLLASAAATRVIESFLFGVRPLDPLTLAAVPTVLIGVGALACWAPARRAARIDPVDVLRET